MAEDARTPAGPGPEPTPDEPAGEPPESEGVLRRSDGRTFVFLAPPELTAEEIAAEVNRRLDLMIERRD